MTFNYTKVVADELRSGEKTASDYSATQCYQDQMRRLQILH